MGGFDSIQLTHSNDRVDSPTFFPDGKRIVYFTTSADSRTSSIEVISTLGGEPRVLFRSGRIVSGGPMLSPDGRQIAYIENSLDGLRLMTISSNGGHPRELPVWARMAGMSYGYAAWTSDSRAVLCLMTRSSEGASSGGFEWFAFPTDGGNPVATGAGDALRAAGLDLGFPILAAGDRVLFGVLLPAGNFLTWEIRLSPGSLRVRGIPRQLTFGTLHEVPTSISATGTVALEVGSEFNNLYLIPLSPATGQPTGVAQRLTHDGRYKQFFSRLPSQSISFLTGDPGSAYFGVVEPDGREDYYALDLESRKQTSVITGLAVSPGQPAVSPDGRQVAFSVPEGDSFSIRMGDTGASPAEAHLLCKACGNVFGFSPDGRFLFHDREAKVQDDPNRKSAVWLLDVASGKDRPWLEHPTDSVFFVNRLGQNSSWVSVRVCPPDSPGALRRYVLEIRPAVFAGTGFRRPTWRDSEKEQHTS